MKKFAKIFLILILVAAVVGGTCYFFFKNFKKEEDVFLNISDFKNSTQSLEVTAKLNSIKAYDMTIGGSQSRFTLIYNTEMILNSILDELNLYLVVASDFDINKKDIQNNLQALTEQQEKLEGMLSEYLLKATYPSFNKALGSNDVFVAASKYMVKLADLVEIINSAVKNNIISNNRADVKFDIFDVYSNVVRTTFGDLITVSEICILGSASNITYMNSHFTLTNGHINTQNSALVGDNYSYYTNLFMAYYNSSDKTVFAKNLYTKITAVTSVNEESDNITRAYYYLRLILGV